MRTYDKGWSELNRTKVGRISPQPIATLAKRNLASRIIKAATLFCSTRYSWNLSWQEAGR